MKGEFDPVYSSLVLAPSYRNWRRLYAEASIRVHRAHLVMLARQGIVSPQVAQALKRGIDELEQGWTAPAERPEEGRVEDLYFLFEKELGVRVGEEEAAWLHTARSRNDMDGSIFRLVLKDALLGLLELCALSARLLETRCEQGRDELTVLYTHGQPANPSTTGHYLSAFLLDFLADCADLQRAVEDVDTCTLGACAITGTGFPIDRRMTQELLGFERMVENSYRAISSSRWLLTPARSLRGIMLDLGRFVADLGHKASAEVGLYGFPDSLVQVSSIMPQKRNPVILEHVRIRSARTAGLCASIEQMFMNVPYADVNENADEPVSAFMDGLTQAGEAVKLAVTAACAMKANEKRAREICGLFGVTTTELADRLVRDQGIGFRMAHRIASKFVDSGMDQKELFRLLAENTGRESGWDEDMIDSILAPETFIQVRKTEGGPANEGMLPVRRAIGEACGELELWLREKRKHRDESSARLDEAWKSLA